MPYDDVMQIRKEGCGYIRPKKPLRAGTVDAFRGSWHSRLSLGGRIWVTNSIRIPLGQHEDGIAILLFISARQRYMFLYKNF